MAPFMIPRLQRRSLRPLTQPFYGCNAGKMGASTQIIRENSSHVTQRTSELLSKQQKSQVINQQRSRSKIRRVKVSVPCAWQDQSVSRLFEPKPAR
ncbi:hypothetical protein BO83DRAFT_169501 [Aspergillus eucalypticola CBS 122712]|uniref:Uncharacterized protein n=1 Tax=Aspergillus eucalypticola (strain CBS 122712 / IBT 29274) TaxID=1448314 RepID=A0A317W3D5_ASPEC|nr:uncharacterized protein BO83DRAFT_169501 [Aspergillus eucalypticola CBS 122712]PWY81074.1 hypothetical protein BO83DRAFT_169501 [Aspergillus eucalypticola CBS 122712]